MQIPLAPAFFLTALCLPVHAADLFVGPAGSGAPFETIQAAVNAAAPGDRIFVAAGLYNEQVVIQKGIELIGAGADRTTVRTNIGFAFLPVVPALTVQQLPADQRVRISDLGFTGAISGLSVPGWTPVLRLSQNQGRAELSGLKIDLGGLPPSPTGQPGGVLEVISSQQVICDRVRVVAPAGFYAGVGPVTLVQGLSGARVVDSNLWLSACDFQGQWGRLTFPFQSNVSGNGGAGLSAVGSRIDAARTALRGGKGASFPGVQLPASGGAGLVAVSSDLRIAGGTDQGLFGAPAVDDPGQPGAVAGGAGAGLSLAALSTAEIASDAVILGGAGGPTFPAGANIAVDGTSSAATLDRRLPSLSIVPGSPALGQPVAVVYQGEPSSLHGRALWISSGPAVPVPGFGGLLLLDPATLVIAESRILDVAGQAVTVSTLPNLPSLVGLSFVEQSIQVSPPHLDFGPAAIANIQ